MAEEEEINPNPVYLVPDTRVEEVHGEEAYDECSSEEADNHGRRRRRRRPKRNPTKEVPRGRRGQHSLSTLQCCLTTVTTMRQSRLRPHSLFDAFPGYWRMGFGWDDITGSYKIELSPPPYEIGYRRRSTCVNGSIYWVEVTPRYKLLALHLHTEQWRDISLPSEAVQFQTSCQVTNLENRLVLASTYPKDKYWNVKIWGMNNNATWSLIYSIRLLPLEEEHFHGDFFHLWFWTRPVVISKEGNLFIHDNKKRLFKYCPETDDVCCVAENVCVISPFVEDLIPYTENENVWTRASRPWVVPWEGVLRYRSR
ncbi:unnamed protein product [Eruca vesicaria subsp. sativa]|uniref:F-box associated domain-containing protein n=1 Tax=Eruca vesicaria subsp. sativa TaxID=29727 RepID=A0ABC8KJC0_ERUVS|nr:unnamed protein product [Eruca vesicaria subsp. sativa]